MAKETKGEGLNDLRRENKRLREELEMQRLKRENEDMKRALRGGMPLFPFHHWVMRSPFAGW